MAKCSGPTLLKRFIKRKGLEQVEAAGQLIVPPSALSQYLTRKQRPRGDIRERIAKWSEGAVPEGAWLTRKERSRLARVHAAVSPDPDEAPESEHKTKSPKTAA